MELADVVWLAILVVFACVQLAFVYAALAIGSATGVIREALVFLFQNWIIQALFAAWVAFALQQVHQKSIQKAELFQKRYDQKLAAIQAFFGLVDKRAYASRAYLTALRAQSGDENWTSERERYREVVKEWNERAPGILVMMLTLLPARMCFQIERQTFLAFSSMDSLLGQIRKARAEGKVSEAAITGVWNLLSELAENSSIALAEFLNLAREEQKLIDQKPAISEENSSNLPLGYLISSLFKTSVN